MLVLSEGLKKNSTTIRNPANPTKSQPTYSTKLPV